MDVDQAIRLSAPDRHLHGTLGRTALFSKQRDRLLTLAGVDKLPHNASKNA